MLKNVGRVCRWIISIILIIIIICNMTLIIKAEINPDEIPDIFGYKPFIVVTGSMEPGINIDDIIITKEVNENELKIGDVISYYDEEDEIIVTHRIIAIEDENGQKNYTTKGDNNNIEDDRKVNERNVEGIYLFKIPGLGKIARYAQKPIPMAIVMAIIIIIFLIIEIIIKIMITKENED